MRTEPLFRPLPRPAQKEVQILFDEQPFTVPAGISVASALLLIGAGYSRQSPVTGAKRAPYCMMGVCFECLVEVDGRPSQQGCMIEVRAGMQIRRQSGAASFDTRALEVKA